MPETTISPEVESTSHESPQEKATEPKPIISLEEWNEIEASTELEPNERILYHGTQERFYEFETPTGNEEMDVTKGGVVYFYDDLERAGKYKGANYICVSKAQNSVPYAEQRRIQGLKKKKGHFTRGVYVALPSKVEVIGFIPANEVR